METVQDRVVQVEGTNREMSDAIDQARASIGEFFRALEHPAPGQNSFLIKARFEDGGAKEHVWLADLDFSTRPATGVVANEPSLKTLTYLERVAFLPDQISDWMYLDGGRLVGGFTTRVLLRAAGRGSLNALRKPSYTM